MLINTVVLRSDSTQVKIAESYQFIPRERCDGKHKIAVV